MYEFDNDKTGTVLEAVEIHNPPENDCSFCYQLGLFDQEGVNPPPLRLLTEEEPRIHTAMREIKKQVHAVKKRIQRTQKESLAGPRENTANGRRYYEIRDKLHRQAIAEDMLDDVVRLDQFKKIWNELDTARVAAAQERMRLLGHVS